MVPKHSRRCPFPHSWRCFATFPRAAIESIESLPRCRRHVRPWTWSLVVSKRPPSRIKGDGCSPLVSGDNHRSTRTRTSHRDSSSSGSTPEPANAETRQRSERGRDWFSSPGRARVRYQARVTSIIWGVVQFLPRLFRLFLPRREKRCTQTVRGTSFPWWRFDSLRECARETV